MNIKYMGENAISYLIEKCKSTFALITHKHTAQEVGADVEGSASAALVLANQHTEEKVEELAINVAYIDGEDNEDIINPDISMSDVVIDSMLSETSINPVQNKVVTEKINELVEEIVDIGEIKTVTGASATVTDAIDGRIISCVGESEVTVSGYNLCSVKELSCVGYGTATFGTKLPAGTYTLTAECVTNNPNITSVRVQIGGFAKTLKCDGERRSFTVSITREVSAILSIWASDQTATITDYSVSLYNIVITEGSSAKKYEPYFKPITYGVDNLNEINLTEYTNIITSDSEFTLRYIHRNAYVEALFSSIDVGTKMYVTPEDFCAYGDGLADDTRALNECIAYAVQNNMPIRGYGKYKTTDTINIIGDYVDLYIYKMDYLGVDDAVLYQGSNSSINIRSIKSKGNGFCVKAETETVYYNTFNINEIISEKNGVHLYAKKNNFQNKLIFNIIKSKGDYSCILFEKDPNTETGYLSEWQIKGGLLTGGLWGVRGHLTLSDGIYIQAEGLGSTGKGGAICSESGQLPRIYYCRNAELVQINTFIKLSGVFYKPQVVEICKMTSVPLASIDITELEVDVDAETKSDNIQALTEIEIQDELFSNTLLTKNLIFWGNRFQFPPVRYIRLDVDNDIDMTPQYYNGVIPQCFVAKSNVAIKLHPTYASNCLDTFEIVQEDGYKLTVYDFVGNMIFDGTQYADGRYRLTAYTQNKGPLMYDMSNQSWDIVTF